MTGLVKLWGIIMLAAGVIYFVKPNAMKKLASYFAKENKLTIGGVVAIIIGLVFLRAASRCSVPLVVLLYGLLAVAKGILVFTLGKQKIITMLDRLIKNPPKTVRKYALIEIILGVALIYAA